LIRANCVDREIKAFFVRDFVFVFNEPDIPEDTLARFSFESLIRRIAQIAIRATYA
jgi:hypothetical protein